MRAAPCSTTAAAACVSVWISPISVGDRARRLLRLLGQLAHLLGDDREPAALLCYGLLGLDRETLAFVAGSPALLKRLYERDASPFAGYAHVLRVRNGALELPGGAEAAPIWDALAGAPTADAASGILALLTRDNARLAYFAEALETLDSAHLALVFPPNATADARAAAARLAYRSFVTVDALRDLADLPFQRVSYDPGALLAALPLEWVRGHRRAPRLLAGAHPGQQRA